MAKKKPAKKAKPSKAVEAMFDSGVKQDCVMLSDVERAALETISKRYHIARGADALRIAVMREADLCRQDKSKPPERAPTRSNSKGRTMEGDGVDLKLFSFRTAEDDRAGVDVIRKTHDIIKSAAIRHAIRQEAKRCEAESRKK